MAVTIEGFEELGSLGLDPSKKAFSETEYSAGTMYIDDNVYSGNIALVPENVDENTVVDVVFCGAIGGNNVKVSSKGLPEILKETYVDNPDYDHILIISNYAGTTRSGYAKDFANGDRAVEVGYVLDNISNIENAYGVELKNRNWHSSSIGDSYAIEGYVEQCEAGYADGTLFINGAATATVPHLQGHSVNIGNAQNYDPNCAFTDPDRYSVLEGHNIVLTERGNMPSGNKFSPENYTYVKEFVNSGANVTLLKVTNDGGNDDHDTVATILFSDGLLNAAGNKAVAEEIYDKGHIVSALKCTDYDNTLGISTKDNTSYQWSEISRDDAVSAISGNGVFSNSNLINLSRFTSDTDYQITTYDSEVTDTYKSLTKLGKVGISYLDKPELQSNLQNPNIVSDLEYVRNSMNDIRSNINSSSFLGGGLSGMVGGGGIFGCLSGYINAYFNAVAALLSALTTETSSITSFAQAYADLDANYGKKVGEISAINTDGTLTKVELPSGGSLPAAGKAGITGGAAGAASTIAGTEAAEVGKEAKATHNQQTNATPSNTNDFSRRANSNISTERLPDGTYKTYVKHDDGTVSVTTYDRKGNELSEEVMPANGDTVMVDSTAKPEEELIIDNETSSQAAAAAQSGSAARIIKDENSDSVNMDKGVYRPTYSGSGEPISYNKHTKSVDGNKVTHTYYDDEGNVVGETVTENGKVASSYYDYVDENGDTVRVNYGNVPAGAQSHVSTVEDIKTEETVQESSQENRTTPTGTPPVAGETYSDKVDAFRGTGKEESTAKTASQPATESATEPVTESVTEQRDESTDSFKRAGGGIMGNNGPFAGGTGWEEVRDENEANSEGKGLTFKTPITGAEYSINYDKEDKTLTSTRTNQDGSSHQKVTDFNDQTVTNTWVKSDGSSIEQVSDLSSGRLIEQTKYDAESGVTSARNPDGTKTVINTDGSSVTTGAFGKVIEETEGVTVNNGEGFIGHSGKFKVDESKPIQTHDTGIDYGIHPESFVGNTNEGKRAFVGDLMPGKEPKTEPVATPSGNAHGGTGGGGGWSGGGGGTSSIVEPTPEPEPIVEPTPEPTPVVEPTPVTPPTPEPIPVVEPTPEPTPAPAYQTYPSYAQTSTPEPAPVIEEIPPIEPEPVVDIPKTDTVDTVVKHKSNLGRTLGTIAGVAAATAGAAGLAYETNKLIKEKEEEEEENYSSDTEDNYTDDNNEFNYDEEEASDEEINLSDEI